MLDNKISERGVRSKVESVKAMKIPKICDMANRKNPNPKIK